MKVYQGELLNMRKLHTETQHLSDLAPETIEALRHWKRSAKREYRFIMFVVTIIFLCILTAALVGGLRMMNEYNTQLINTQQK